MLNFSKWPNNHCLVNRLLIHFTAKTDAPKKKIQKKKYPGTKIGNKKKDDLSESKICPRKSWLYPSFPLQSQWILFPTMPPKSRRRLCPLHEIDQLCFGTGSGYFTWLISCFLPLIDSFSCPQNKDVFVGCEIYLLRSEWWGNFKLPWHGVYIYT